MNPNSDSERLHEEVERLRRENEELRRRIVEHTFFTDLATKLCGQRADIDELLRDVVERSAELLGAETGSVMLVDEDTNELVIRVAQGLSEEIIRDTRVRIGEMISGRVAHSGQALLIRDIEETAGRANRENRRTKSALSVPIKLGEQVLGVLNMSDKRSGEAFDEGDLELGERLARQAATVVMRAMGERANVAKERIEKDLQFAHTIQQSFLPQSPPEMPGVEISARYVPALEVGGDFYDFIRLSDDTLGVVVGDVSGKGIPAALFMARFTSDFRVLAAAEADPAAVLARANEIVYERSRQGLFVTLAYAVVNGRTGELALANAGHLAPILRSREPGRVRSLEGGGVPLGVLPGSDYVTESLSVEPGECLVFITDGLVEAKGSEGDRYGFARLSSAIAEGPSGAHAIQERVMTDVVRFVGFNLQHDDLTLVCAGRTGK